MAGLPAFSAVEGLLTGNVNLIKLPRGDKGLTLAILSKLVEQEPRLAPFLYAFDIPSSDQKTMQALADLADGLVV
ncbi:MAG: acyl-CoA reductase, partial [Clostridium sp.]|nr:acyl-CoA reductase [Clostridium sp.]